MTATRTKRPSRSVAAAGAMAALVVMAGPAQPARARPSLPLRMDAAFQRECLDAHNQYRARHGALPLRTDPKAVDHAVSRAGAVTQGEGLSRGHAGLQGYGENLHWSGSSVSGRVTSCADAVKAWYSEIREYDFAAGGFSRETGLFTQVVWKSTTSLGCARAAGQGPSWYETYVVCAYSPPGNHQGQFEQNVLPPR